MKPVNKKRISSSSEHALTYKWYFYFIVTSSRMFSFLLGTFHDIWALISFLPSLLCTHSITLSSPCVKSEIKVLKIFNVIQLTNHNLQLFSPDTITTIQVLNPVGKFYLIWILLQLLKVYLSWKRWNSFFFFLYLNFKPYLYYNHFRAFENVIQIIFFNII